MKKIGPESYCDGRETSARLESGKSGRIPVSSPASARIGHERHAMFGVADFPSFAANTRLERARQMFSGRSPRRIRPSPIVEAVPEFVSTEQEAVKLFPPRLSASRPAVPSATPLYAAQARLSAGNVPATAHLHIPVADSPEPRYSDRHGAGQPRDRRKPSDYSAARLRRDQPHRRRRSRRAAGFGGMSRSMLKFPGTRDPG